LRRLLQAQTLLMQFAWMLPSVLFGVYLGVSSGGWHMLFMSLGSAMVWFGAKRFNDSREIDLSEPVSFDGPDVWIGDYQLPKYEIFWKKKWHPVVYAAYLAKTNAPSFELSLELESGIGHCLIIGPTGSGKSELLKLLLGQVINSNTQAELTLIDFKGGATFNRYASNAQVKNLASDIDGHDPEQFWQSIQAEVGRRELSLAAMGVSRIEDLTALGKPMPRHYIFIDELVAALAESPRASGALNAVAARGRSLGIHLVVATQTTQGIPRSMLTNLRAKIALAEADPIELAQLNLKRPAEQLQVPAGWGSGIVQGPGKPSTYFYFPIGASFGF
jgi:energy-coupling factor transporter ATP-binding protein EcfA2